MLSTDLFYHSVFWVVFFLMFYQVKWQNELNTSTRFTLGQHSWLDMYSISSLKQQSEVIATLGHVIFALIPWYFMLCGEATSTNYTVFGFTRPERQPKICHTQGNSNRKEFDQRFPLEMCYCAFDPKVCKYMKSFLQF